MFQPNVAPGVHRIEDAYVNWFLLEGDGGLTIVDAGLPVSPRSLSRALAELGRSRSDVQALVLTHAHFDHVGFAEKARVELGIPVWVHEEDVPLTGHPLRYDHERSRLPYLVKPRAVPIVAALVRAGMLRTKPIAQVRAFGDGDELDVPGRPRVVATPGHTYGHVSLALGDGETVIAGDALVTLNPYTGERGPQIVAGAATADSGQALASLGRLAETGARTLLTGHGEPWTDGAVEAVRRARAKGPS